MRTEALVGTVVSSLPCTKTTAGKAKPPTPPRPSSPARPLPPLRSTPRFLAPSLPEGNSLFAWHSLVRVCARAFTRVCVSACARLMRASSEVAEHVRCLLSRCSPQSVTSPPPFTHAAGARAAAAAAASMTVRGEKWSHRPGSNPITGSALPAVVKRFEV